MESYLSNGIAAKIKIENEWYSELDLRDNINKIKDSLNKIIDLSNYQCFINDDNIEFIINKDFFEKNIHELVKEIDPITSCQAYFMYGLFKKNAGSKGKCGMDLKDFNMKKYPLKLRIKGNEISLIGTSKRTPIKCYDFLSPWVRPATGLLSGLKVNIGFIPLWIDCEKYNGEEENSLLELLNYFSRNKFKNQLSNSLLFYILG